MRSPRRNIAYLTYLNKNLIISVSLGIRHKITFSRGGGNVSLSVVLIKSGNFILGLNLQGVSGICFFYKLLPHKLDNLITKLLACVFLKL